MVKNPKFSLVTKFTQSQFLKIRLVYKSFHTKKLCSRLSSSEVRFYKENGRFAFLSPLEGLRSNVRWSSYVHWKARSELPVTVNWCFSLCVTAEALWPNIGSKSAISLQRGSVDAKFQVEGSPIPTILFAHKTRLNDLSYGIKIWTFLSSVLLQCTRLTDGQTDGRTEFSSLDRACIPWKWKCTLDRSRLAVTLLYTDFKRPSPWYFSDATFVISP